MLAPKRRKFRKERRERMKRKATKCNYVAFGDYGLMALEPSWITANQIEAARIVISKNLKKGGKLWIRVFPHKPVTKKPAESRMGGGKADVEKYVAVVRPGVVMFELTGLKKEDAYEVLTQASYKLPIKTKIVEKE
jgi:large subunit ribosomal protein L16